MAWRKSREANENMVISLKGSSLIQNKAVEDAFLNVPRAAFLPEDMLDEAYADMPIHGYDHLHMSAPHMYATVLEALDLKPGMSFLNIGSGTGYFSMLAGFILGTQGVNHGIEFRGNLVEHANQCCDELLVYNPAMKTVICYPQFIVGNCFNLDTSPSMYDRVYCGAACPVDRLKFLVQLVKLGGFVVVPCGSQLLKLTRAVPSEIKESILDDVSFESLILPDDTDWPKLKFPVPKRKSRKLKVYPPPHLLVSKTSARKSLARLRALQDVVDCWEGSRSIPKSFAYVPLLAQVSQLTEKPKAVMKDQAKLSVHQTVDFFGLKSLGTKEDLSSIPEKATEEISDLCSDLQADTIWESVVDYTYSLCSTGKYRQQGCLEVYTKVKRKKMKKHVSHSVAEHVEFAPNLPNNGSSNVSDDFQPCEVMGDCCSIPTRELAHRSSKSLERKGNVCTGSQNSCGSCSGRTSKGKQYQNGETVCQNIRKEELNRGRESQSGCHQGSMFGSSADLTKGMPYESDGSHGRQEIRRSFNDNGEVPKTLSKSESLVSRKLLCPIKMNELLTNKLATVPGPNWTSDEDIQLVQLLINTLGCDTSKLKGKHLSNHISVTPSVFSASVLVRYPKISSYAPEALTFRALALFRVVRVLDRVISFMCSSSPALDLVNKPLSERPYPLASFSESSFASSRPAPVNRADFLSGKEDNALFSGKENIRRHKDSIQQKIDLCKSKQGPIREHQILLKKKIQSFDEQLSILQGDLQKTSSRELEQHDVQQLLNELNLKRHEVVDRQQEIVKEQKQRDQEAAQLKLQLEWLHGEEVKFLKLIESYKQCKKKVEENLDGCGSVGKHSSAPLDAGTEKGNLDSKHRYMARSILSSLRFLLPLSSHRVGIISELLHATEQPLPDQIPVVYIDRRIPVAERIRSPKKSVFYQIYEEVKAENMSFRWNKRKCDQWWEVKFVGEGIIDQGGGFRDSLAELSDELCPRDPNITQTLPLFVRSVNQRDQVGEYRDCFVPSPSCKDLKMFCWLGKLMGAAYRSNESLAIHFPPFIWKLLAGEHVSWCADFACVDEASVNVVNHIEVVGREEFSEVYAKDLNFTTAFSDGNVVEVRDSGHQIPVEYDARLDYCKLVKKARMMESVDQVKAIREGLLAVIPQSLIELITSEELERGVCGCREISLSALKESIRFGDDLSSDSECVRQLWKVLEIFSTEDRSQFLRFVTGRKRLPAFITLSQMCGEKDTLPSASTCASTLMLPSYSSVKVAEKKLRYAIYHCVAIDTDTNPW